jgi:hypothetical protein
VRRHPLDPRLKPGADYRRALGLGIQMMRRSPHRLRGQGELDVVHVIVGDTSPPADGRSIGGLRELTADLGARWHETEDDDPAWALVSFAYGPGAGRTKPA